MALLHELLPDHELLLAMEPEELGWYLLEVARPPANNPGAMFHASDFTAHGNALDAYEKQKSQCLIDVLLEQRNVPAARQQACRKPSTGNPTVDADERFRCLSAPGGT